MSNCQLHDPEKEAARTRIWGGYGRHMGLNSGIFWQKDRNKTMKFQTAQSDDFTGVFCQSP
jgi:hypothetical protein